MRLSLALLLVVHGLIHLMGPAKSFGWAELPQLTQPVSRPAAVLWLVAAALLLATAVALFAWPRRWWAVGVVALAVSQTAIGLAWGDAKFGTVGNLVLAAGIVHELFFRARI